MEGVRWPARRLGGEGGCGSRLRRRDLNVCERPKLALGYDNLAAGGLPCHRMILIGGESPQLRSHSAIQNPGGESEDQILKDRTFERLKESVFKFGVLVPIVVHEQMRRSRKNRTNWLTANAGAGRAQAVGAKRIPAHIARITGTTWMIWSGGAYPHAPKAMDTCGTGQGGNTANF